MNFLLDPNHYIPSQVPDDLVDPDRYYYIDHGPVFADRTPQPDAGGVDNICITVMFWTGAHGGQPDTGHLGQSHSSASRPSQNIWGTQDSATDRRPTFSFLFIRQRLRLLLISISFKRIPSVPYGRPAQGQQRFFRKYVVRSTTTEVPVNEQLLTWWLSAR